MPVRAAVSASQQAANFLATLAPPPQFMAAPPPPLPPPPPPPPPLPPLPPPPQPPARKWSSGFDVPPPVGAGAAGVAGSGTRLASSLRSGGVGSPPGEIANDLVFAIDSQLDGARARIADAGVTQL